VRPVKRGQRIGVGSALTDFDEDGRKDLAVANLDSDNVSVLLNTSTSRARARRRTVERSRVRLRSPGCGWRACASTPGSGVIISTGFFFFKR
jgi:hypothetical protein